MTELKTVDVFVAMDSDGDYALGTDMDEAITAYNDNIGGTLPIRVVKLNVSMRPPVEVEVDVNVPDEAGQEVQAQA